jgi:hypothetical protein
MARTAVTSLAAVLALAGCGGGRPVVHDEATLWCYDTLADPECYTEPDPARRTGFLGTVELE